ncbi:MAG TPA: lactate permease LctP family transporter, partial [Blastocatellia bacterium]|nr:lactate permease LctP family transporter [Blastocatellia bacterium]
MSNFFLTWTQVYDPLNSWPLSTAVAALPVLTLFFVLVVVKARVWVSALCGLLAALLLAALVFKMPVVLVAAAAGHGFIFGMIRIAWVIVASIFLYNIACETGQFEVMKQSIAGLSSDKRLQLVLIAFCFGAFLEGTGGGGAPVAIAGSFLIGLGFKPFQAATLCLIANTAPVAWGGVGNPIRVLAEVTGLPQMQFSAMAGRILPPLSFILPFWLVRSMVGWKETFQVWPALLVSGLSFATMQFYWSNYQEAGLVDVISAVFSLLVMVVFLKFWKPAKELKIEGMAQSAVRNPQSTIQVLKAWSPFILSSVLIFIASYPKINKYLLFSELRVPMPALHNAVLKVPPVAPQPTPEAAMIDFNFIGIPGTAVFVGGLISALLLGLSLKRTLQIFGETLKEMIPSLLAISFMVGLAYVTRYGGMDTVLGLSLTGTGMLFPFFGTLLGWLGVALTGTDAGSN